MLPACMMLVSRVSPDTSIRMTRRDLESLPVYERQDHCRLKCLQPSVCQWAFGGFDSTRYEHPLACLCAAAFQCHGCQLYTLLR
jgi:hypothetical protein